MKYCSYCGTQMPDAARFCPKCGKAAMQNKTEPRPGVTEQAKNNIQIHPASRGADNAHASDQQKPITSMNLSLTPAKIIKWALTLIVVLLLFQIGLGFAHKGFLYEYTLKQAIAYHLSISRGYEEGESDAKVITLHIADREENSGGTMTLVCNGMAKCNDSTFAGTRQNTVYYVCVLQVSIYTEFDTYNVNSLNNYREREDYKLRNPILRFAESLFGINIMYTETRDSEQQMQILAADVLDSGTRDIADYRMVNSTKLNELLNQYDADYQPQPVEERAYKIFGTLESVKQRNDGFVLWLDCSDTATDPEDYYADTTVLIRIPYDMANMEDVVRLPTGVPIVCCGYFDTYFEDMALSNCHIFVPYYTADDNEYYTDDQLNNYPFNDGIAFMLEHNISAAKICEDGEAEKRYTDLYQKIQGNN